MEPVTRDTAVLGFAKLGITAGDTVLIHSALRPFGYVEGGAQTIAQALYDSVSPGGTVVAPAFCFVHEVQENPIIDPAADMSEMGAISEAIRNMPGAVRSVAYRHSFSAIGKNSATVTDVDWKLPVFHMQSSFGRMYALNTKVILAGVTYVNSTSHHFAEYILQVQDRHTIEKKVRLKQLDGSLIETVMTDYQPKPTESGAYYSRPRDFNKYGLMLEKEGKVKISSIGNAMVRVFYMRDLIHLIMRSYPLDDSGFSKKDGEELTILPDGKEVYGVGVDGAGRVSTSVWACVDPQKIHNAHKIKHPQ